MTEHYDVETLRISRDLYEKIRDWGRRGGVTLIGGWAVYELVKPFRHNNPATWISSSTMPRRSSTSTGA